GEIEVHGPDATELTQRLTTNDVTALKPGKGQYSAVTDERGVMLDDTVVYDRPDEGGYLFVPNAGHDEELYDHWCASRKKWNLDCTVENVTEQYAMIAVQGPESEAHLSEVTETVQDLGRFEIASASVAGVNCLCSRTGYTGEDGFELLCPWDDAQTVWDAINCQPCGLGARDTLRIEQGFLLSGQDFDPESNPRTPYEAGIGFVVDTDSRFLGREALAEATPNEQFVGIELTERGVPRNGYAIESVDGTEIGTVTSGTLSPTLGVSIGLGYVSTAHAEPGTEIRVVIRGDRKAGLITNPPFEHATTEQ
ncbi:glycine cleavage system aminomethyltransferase GcvT, partial [Halocatena pleomorpha]